MCPKKIKALIVLQRVVSYIPSNSSPKAIISHWSPKGDPMSPSNWAFYIFIVLEDDQYGSNIFESSAYVVMI
jgi:hypothetical protein